MSRNKSHTFVIMEIKFLKLIKTIAEEGSLANSSTKLFLTQSALSHQLKEIEENLGFKVFFRTRNKWELTNEGAELYKIACEVIHSLDKGFENLKQLRKGSVGTIKMSTECYSFYHGLPAFIQKMSILYPEINVDLILEATHQPVHKILSNELDIAITTIKPEDDKLLSFQFFEDEIFALIHCENQLSKKKYLTIDDFSAMNLIIHSYPLETVSVYQNFCKPSGVKPKQITAIPLTEIALEMVEANMGIICLPKWALKLFRISEEVIFKRIGINGLKRNHYIVVRKSDEKKQYINDFILNFKESFKL